MHLCIRNIMYSLILILYDNANIKLIFTLLFVLVFGLLMKNIGKNIGEQSCIIYQFIYLQRLNAKCLF